MLERADTSRPRNSLVFRNITTDAAGTGICYVTGGQTRVSRINKPFVVLYLQDVEGAVIPGYIFEVDNFKASGLDLTKITHSLVQVTYQENYSPRYGLSIILKDVQWIQNPPMDLLTAYVGQVDNTAQLFQRLSAAVDKKLGMSVTLPFTITNIYHPDYNQGRAGGVLKHYWDVFHMLQAIEGDFSPEQQVQLYSTFILYIFAHSNYLTAESKEEADINLITRLTASVSKYIEKLQMGKGALEIVHIFFGYEPKDIYVRLITYAASSVRRMNAEVNMWKTLPDSREGNAGYGTIKRYLE